MFIRGKKHAVEKMQEATSGGGAADEGTMPGGRPPFPLFQPAPPLLPFNIKRRVTVVLHYWPPFRFISFSSTKKIC